MDGLGRGGGGGAFRVNLVISKRVMQGSVFSAKYPVVYSHRNFRQLQRRAAVRSGLFC